jgi:hypothetical protein
VAALELAFYKYNFHHTFAAGHARTSTNGTRRGYLQWSSHQLRYNIPPKDYPLVVVAALELALDYETSIIRLQLVLRIPIEDIQEYYCSCCITVFFVVLPCVVVDCYIGLICSIVCTSIFFATYWNDIQLDFAGLISDRWG